MKIVIEVNMDNASFTENTNELKEVLNQIPVANSLKAGDYGDLRDSNGNKVGTWDVFDGF